MLHELLELCINNEYFAKKCISHQILIVYIVLSFTKNYPYFFNFLHEITMDIYQKLYIFLLNFMHQISAQILSKLMYVSFISPAYVHISSILRDKSPTILLNRNNIFSKRIYIIWWWTFRFKANCFRNFQNFL